MTDVAGSVPQKVERGGGRSLRELVAATEIDLRLLGIVAALAAILIGFGLITGGKFLEPVNIVALSVQTASVAIIATGMVLVIVSRNIDLSVGSIVGVVAMTYALLMTDWLPHIMGFDNPFMWLVALAIGLAVGGLIGAFQGFIIAYIGVPSFVVTLGGLLAFRGVVFVMSSGASVSGLDPNFQLLGGGPEGSLGGTLSWIVGGIICVAIIGLLYFARRQRRRFGFGVRPMWAEALIGVIGCATVLGVIAYFNAYLWPAGLAQKYAEAHNIPVPPGGLQIEAGIPFPIVIVLLVTVVMTFIATRRRFGRYVYAYGGNPDAAELAGINTRWTIMKTFILIGILCGLSGAIAAARLNGSTLDVGSGYELLVIAAAVVGGTSFAGGIGTIPGAVLGALLMQALAYGLAFVGLSSPVQNIFAGAVLVVAVGLDTINRRRGGG
jgi:D-xylose transport system permease protein